MCCLPEPTARWLAACAPGLARIAAGQSHPKALAGGTEALKVAVSSAETPNVQFERLVIEAGSNTFTLPLHPRLTVIAGVGQTERDSLLAELVGALGSGRSGVHAELVDDAGRHLAVFRPEGAKHRVVDIDSETDVSAEFTSPEGRVDLLLQHGIDLRSARRRMRFSASDLTTGTQGAALIRHLAGRDQAQLWRAAEELRRTDDQLQSVAEEVGSAPEDADLVDRVEQRHAQLEVAQNRQERHRKKTFLGSFAFTVAAVPLGFLSPIFAFPALALAVISVLVSVGFHIGVRRAARREEEALSAAGAQSYLGFTIQRVNGLLSSDAHRKALTSAAEEHRRAVAAWRAAAGDIQVEWALEHRDEVMAAARTGKDFTALSALAVKGSDDDRTADLARVVVARLAQLRTLGIGGESFPLVLDDPFSAVDKETKPALLELLSHTAGSPQLIFLTEDEDVASWARLEALTGSIAIVEPQPEQTERPEKPERPARMRDRLTAQR